MGTNMHPATRRIMWLIIAIGIITVLAAVIMPFLKIGNPQDSTAPFILGSLWIIVGILLMRWLRPIAEEADETDTIVDSLNHINARLDAMEKTLHGLQAQPEGPNAMITRLDHEVENLATTVQDAHKRLDSLGDVNSRLNELETQLDSLYVTLHDTHKRIDDLEQAGNR